MGSGGWRGYGGGSIHLIANLLENEGMITSNGKDNGYGGSAGSISLKHLFFIFLFLCEFVIDYSYIWIDCDQLVGNGEFQAITTLHVPVHGLDGQTSMMTLSADGRVAIYYNSAIVSFHYHLIILTFLTSLFCLVWRFIFKSPSWYIL